MKMADGGFRPAYNPQVATVPGAQVVVGVGVTNSGGDARAMIPVVDAVAACSGTLPPLWLTDGGFVNGAAITEAAGRGVTVYVPVAAPKRARAPHVPRAQDGPAVAAWRVRMGTAEAQGIYKDRAATAEGVNVLGKDHRGLYRLRVRGLAKVLCVALWMAVTHNHLRWAALAQAAARTGRT